jgi:hypothetical protein
MGKRMILDRTIEAYSRTSYKDSEGIQQFTYSKALTIRAQIQPAALAQSQLASWGLTNLEADSKIMFLPGNPELSAGMVIKDLSNSARYEVRGMNPWPRHSECLIFPYQGTEPI